MTSRQCSSKPIDGKSFAEGLRGRIARAAAETAAAHGLIPGLAVVLVGEDPASQVYVRSKEKATVEAGFRSVVHRLVSGTTQTDLLALVRTLNQDPSIHGILVQLPLPPHLEPAPIIAAIDPAKDVDGLTQANTSLLWSGGDGLFPCTPLGCVMLLKAELGRLDGLHAVVLGRSALVGKPVAALLLRENCTVSIAHSRSQDVAALCRTGEILVSATGHAELVRGSWIKPGATVIDVGISRVEIAGGKSRLVGDVAFEEALSVARAITPVPGGVGPMTIACLLRNTLSAACRQTGIAEPLV